MKILLIALVVGGLLVAFLAGWTTRLKRIAFLVRVARVEHLGTVGINNLRFKNGAITAEEKQAKDLASHKKFSSRVYKILKITCLYENPIKDEARKNDENATRNDA